jgi:hypothetical protein
MNLVILQAHIPQPSATSPHFRQSQFRTLLVVDTFGEMFEMEIDEKGLLTGDKHTMV